MAYGEPLTRGLVSTLAELAGFVLVALAVYTLAGLGIGMLVGGAELLIIGWALDVQPMKDRKVSLNGLVRALSSPPPGSRNEVVTNEVLDQRAKQGARR